MNSTPEIVWTPTPQQVQQTHIARLMRDWGIPDYPSLHAFSTSRRGLFWERIIRELGIVFHQTPQTTLPLNADPKHPDWLRGARMNIADSCFHPLTDPKKPAILWGRADGSITAIDYATLELLSRRVAHGLAALGVRPGERVAVDLPMSPESVAIYLGIIRTGAAAVSIADSFAPNEIATRLRITNATLVFTQDVIRRSGKSLPLYEKVVAAGAEKIVVVTARGELAITLRDQDLDFDAFLGDSDKPFHSIPRAPSDPSNILFSSGTTGDPKAIPWTHTTPIKCAADAMLHQDIHAHDILCWPTSLGWMMGPWLIYAALLNRATMALSEDAPTTRPFIEFVSKSRTTMLGVVPSIVSHWRASGATEGLDLSNIRRYSSTGECSNADDMRWLMTRTGESTPRPIIEYCGGTEIGGGYITSTMVQPNAPATFTTPALGLDLILLDEQGRGSDNGEVFLIPPSIGLSETLLNRDHDEVYYANGHQRNGVPLRTHGDQIERITSPPLRGGGKGVESPSASSPGALGPNHPVFYRALGRADDTMNLGGIKVSSAEIERVLASIPGVCETAAIALNPPGGGPSRLIIFVVADGSADVHVRNPGATGGSSASAPLSPLKKSMQKAIREQLNPLFHIHDVVQVDSLPRTASNKVMRRELRARYHG